MASLARPSYLINADFVSFFSFLHFVVLNGKLSHGKFGSLFPKDSQLQQSRATQLLIKVQAGSFRVATDTDSIEL